MHKGATAVAWAVAVLTSAAAGCSTNLDCSLAGTCLKGVCQCEDWTRGPTCAELNLEPLASASDLAPLVQPQTQATHWGGTVVKADDGKFHLFSAEMMNNCSLGVWGSLSTVIHSVGDSEVGPFTRVGVAIPHEAHNPVVSRTADKSLWLIWTCGCPQKSTPAGCQKETITCPGGAGPTWTTTVYSSPTLDGPWTPHVDMLGDITRGRLGSQNVVPLMRADGSVAVMFKGPDNNTEASIAVAPHWSGPYTMAAVNIFARFFDENITNEDCWFWQSADGNYHALSHRMTPADRESPVCGGHAFATSLTDWSYALTPAYNRTVDVKGAATPLPLMRRERPQLYLGGPNNSPQVLYTAVQVDGRPPFTFAQRLGQASHSAVAEE